MIQNKEIIRKCIINYIFVLYLEMKTFFQEMSECKNAVK
jgi:hypothetical protein